MLPNLEGIEQSCRFERQKRTLFIAFLQRVGTEFFQKNYGLMSKLCHYYLSQDPSDLLLSIRYILLRTAVAQWLRCCVTNRKVVGSIPAGVIGIFH